MPSLKGPSKVMKAYIFQQLVDLYGNIPFSDALKGAGSLAPAFDEQKTIYENLILLLDEGIKDLKENAFDATTSSADIVFKGGTAGTTNWVRFANSLKLRILIRQSKVSGRDNYIITEINKAAATTEGFLAIGQDVGSNPGYTRQPIKQILFTTAGGMIPTAFPGHWAGIPGPLPTCSIRLKLTTILSV